MTSSSSSSSSLPSSGGGVGGGGVDQRCQVTKVDTVLLHGVAIVSLLMEGKERLCLAQISSTLLKPYSYNEIHNRRVALGITCVQCTPVQLEILRRAGAMPVSSRRCGMITRREAERLVKSFLDDVTPPKLPENFVFDVDHDCGWGCRGSFHPSRYNSSRAKCIQCVYCDVFFSPNKFIFHFHRTPGAKYNHPDAANFNSWRRHLKLTPGAELSEGLLHAWEDVKAMFNGGNRRRIHPGGHQHQGTATKVRRLGERGPGKDGKDSAAPGNRVPLDARTANSSLRADERSCSYAEDTRSTRAPENTAAAAAAADLHRQFSESKGHSVQEEVSEDDEDGRTRFHSAASNADGERNTKTDQRQEQEADREEDNDTDTDSIDVDTVEEEVAAASGRRKRSAGKGGIGVEDIRKRSVSVEKMSVDSMEEEAVLDQSPAPEEFPRPGQTMAVVEGRTWKTMKNSVGDKVECLERDVPAEPSDVRQQLQAIEGQRQQQQQQPKQPQESERVQRDNRRPKWKSFDGKWSSFRDHEESRSAGFHPYLGTLSKEELKQKLSTEMEVRVKMEKEFRHLKDSLSSEVERQRERREESDRRLEHLKEARDALRTLSYGLLVPATKTRCAACAYRDSFTVAPPSISFLSNVNVAFTGK